MLVSHRYRFIYTKTMKTGGTSVESYFERFCMPDGEWTQSHGREEYVSDAGIIGFRGRVRPKSCVYWNHMPAALIRSRIGSDVWDEYFKFCVIRNPYDKAVSTFFFNQFRDEGAVQWRGLSREKAAFERWVQDNVHWLGEQARYMIDGTFCLDAVIRYENLLADLEVTCLRLGLPWNPGDLPTFKTGVRPKEARADLMYTAKAKGIIQNALGSELELFGYTFPEAPSSNE